jgi:copper chaperone CopZ
MKTTLTIKGTHCASCKALIEDVCTEISGIQSCSVDFKTGKTEIEHDENVDWEKFKKEVESLGKYEVKLNS